MKKLILLFAISLLSFTLIGQNQETKKTRFDYTKVLVTNVEINNVEDIREQSENDFLNDERSVVVHPTENKVTFSMGFMDITYEISKQDYSIIHKQWKLQVKDSDFAYIIIGDEYCILKVEDDGYLAVLLTDKFDHNVKSKGKRKK